MVNKIESLINFSSKHNILGTTHQLVQVYCLVYHAVNKILFSFPQHNKLQQRASPCTRNQVWLKIVPPAFNDMSM